MTMTGFHEGETATQRRAGVEAEAKRLEGMLDSPGLSGGAARFLAAQRFAALTGRDHDGVLWTSPLIAAPGFLRGRDDVLRVSASPRSGDPLHRLPAGQQVGLIAIDFATRRRLRVNGELVGSDDAGLAVRVDQSYGNCPKYIHPHTIDTDALGAPASLRARRATLDPSDQAMIARSDTFFLGTSHPTRGSDASHRGGPPGFVRVDAPDRLWWPDFPGNNMFNSYGNLAVDDEAALLFVDFGTGASLHLTGTAQVRWTSPGAPGDDGGVGRNVSFSVGAVVSVGNR
ncbi:MULTISPECIES: pyridoxamine 5'-phosphate oxidase family protein [unclassified Mycobacterium]|uniref:pyridoxamine 5'-phosphate oxidase family protein n=1 Tax=unclassified Mycobacterium TaxID=2642494 RepID=UPI0007FE16FF|nr:MULTISPECIES: pyridoxamine 5'-phosphate oxidase family protein [unclassified Mycobacterium]OBG60473.1 pyridoxamine 5'-phosphate oxidase [Mycobacterium sp. E188]OBG62436.1 pyridoxamine 5'-phosphate oxidase [Mycobacterium sp. E735]OBG81388.1 pyridoxamine 5'-phosphate oxidase [Mycobacterium sp. E3305]OBG93065.1 pyridoxamine 5'-phosphate oxidase [Mycobacterium sp. E3298]OBH14070.1 pyridoxamine 5'-phosphate oxidase [Mycobacterium sp. E1715]